MKKQPARHTESLKQCLGQLYIRKILGRKERKKKRNTLMEFHFNYNGKNKR